MNSNQGVLNTEAPSLQLDNLTAEERRALEIDFALAVRIQQAKLPDRVSSLPGWTTHFHYRPVGPVGGDYCDLFESDGNLLFFLGDVSGKGFGASLLASHLQATFRGLAEASPPLQEMVEAANRIFCRSAPSDQFATLIVGSADREGSVEFINAGHVPLLHIGNGVVGTEGATGVPLGLFADACFSSRRLSLEEGELLLMCTDGVTEARNLTDEEYGFRRLAAAAGRHHGAEPVSLIEECLKDLRSFTRQATSIDDISLLSIGRAVLQNDAR